MLIKNKECSCIAIIASLVFNAVLTACDASLRGLFVGRSVVAHLLNGVHLWPVEDFFNFGGSVHKRWFLPSSVKAFQFSFPAVKRKILL